MPVQHKDLLLGSLAVLLVDIAQSTFAAIEPVEVVSHESASAAVGALAAKARHFLIFVYFVVLQYGQLDLLLLMLDLLGLGVHLLLPLLTTTTQAKHKVERALLLHSRYVGPSRCPTHAKPRLIERILAADVCKHRDKRSSQLKLSVKYLDVVIRQGAAVLKLFASED